MIKIEFLLGVAQLLIDTINVSEYQHIQEKLSETIVGLESMKALIDKSEHDAQLDEYGYMRPSLIPLQVISTIIPTLYPRLTEIIQRIGASGMVTLPTEKGFDSAIREDLGQYLQATNTNAENGLEFFVWHGI